jgi:hypothetical protein
VDADRPVVSLPRTRGDCIGGPRPCPALACRYHLDSPSESCALDVADRGPHTLEQIAVVVGLTRERVRQIEDKAIRKVRRALARRAERGGGTLEDFLPPEQPAGGVLP